MAKYTLAAGYIRMSTDDQEASPDQQRAEVCKYAEKHDYKIVNWYQDLGISGDQTEKRYDFQKMIAEASMGGFEAILCWDQDRFGRFDMIEAGRWIHPLRQAGVHLATCTDGLIDWSDMAGRLVYSVKQEGKHQFLRDLSKNVTRGMDEAASKGFWVAGVPPYGYVVGDDRRLHLAPPEDVAIVKEIFSRYLAGESSRQISNWLSDVGHLSPKGKKWTSTGILSLLKNERYLGYLVYNQRTNSKYKDASNPRGRVKMKPRSQWTIVQNTHQAIISQADFDAVQDIMKRNTRKTCPTAGKVNALTGLLRCGCCGYSMIRDLSNKTPKYICYSYQQRPGSCERYNVREDVALREILKTLRTEYFDIYFTPEAVVKLKAEMRKQLCGPQADVEMIKHQLKTAESKVEQARRRLVEVSADMVRHIEVAVREAEDRCDQLKLRLKEADKPQSQQVTAVEERINAAIQWLDELEALVETDFDGSKVNHMLRQFIDKVELQMERKAIGTKGYHRCDLVGGKIYFKTNGIARFQNAGSCTERWTIDGKSLNCETIVIPWTRLAA